MRVVFMGTPDFGVPSLIALYAAGHHIAGVFTQPDRPQGRKQLMVPCAVKQKALEMNLPVYQFEKVSRRIGRETIESLRPDVMVTAAFGQILSRRILAVPPFGCVNVHGSLLPKYRGAAPIQWAIIRGEKRTGVTTMLTAAGVDTGDILLQRELAIGPEETAAELFPRMAQLGAQMIVETLAGLEGGRIAPRAQDEADASHLPMLGKADGCIDWRATAGQVHDRVRGTNPWPGAYTTLPDGSVLKIWRTRVLADAAGQPGEVLDSTQHLVIACASGAVEIVELQAPGKKRMAAADFLRGQGFAHERIGDYGG